MKRIENQLVFNSESIAEAVFEAGQAFSIKKGFKYDCENTITFASEADAKIAEKDIKRLVKKGFLTV